MRVEAGEEIEITFRDDANLLGLYQYIVQQVFATVQNNDIGLALINLL